MTDLRAALQDGAKRLAAKGVHSPAADMRLLAEHVLGLDAAGLSAALVLGSRRLSSAEAAQLERAVARREQRVPVQHITGVAHFRMVTLQVGPGVFIPRPETELLVEHAMAALPEGGRVLDLCTGSGAVALSLKAERPDAQVAAVELSPEAVVWARRNRDALGLAVPIVEADATTLAAPAWPENPVDGIEWADWLGRCDVVTANPPYIPLGAVPLDPEVRDHDPQLALYGDSDDGLAIPVKVAATAARLLRPGGVLIMEHADTQGDSLPRALMASDHWVSATDRRDLARRSRHTVAVRAQLDATGQPGHP